MKKYRFTKKAKMRWLGILSLIMAAILVVGGMSGTTPLECDATGLFIFVPAGLYFLFGKKGLE